MIAQPADDYLAAEVVAHYADMTPNMMLVMTAMNLRYIISFVFCSIDANCQNL